MAQQGVSGARDILEGKAGFFMCVSGLREDGQPRFDVAKVNQGFGDEWRLRDMVTLSRDQETGFREKATEAGLPQDQQSRVVELVTRLDEQDDLSRLIANLVVGGA